MRKKTKIFLAGVVSAMVLGTGAVATSAFAQTNITQGPSGLVQAIATKFNLKESDVEAVFNDYHSQMEADHQKMVEDQLNQAVTDGKITSAQKDLIVSKMKEVKQKLADIRLITNETDRRAALQQLHTDLQTWATQNNIDESLLRSFGPHGHHGGFGLRHISPGMM